MPVGAHPEFGLLVHAVGANLHLQNLALGAHHRGVQGAVAVLLGVGDVVVELVGDVVPQAVYQPQGGVAIGDFRHQDAHRAYIVDLGEADSLALHLSPYAVYVLGTPVNFETQPGPAQHLGQLRLHLGNELVALHPLAVQQAGDLAIGIAVQIAKRQVLQLPLELAYTQAMGQRRIYIEHFPGDRQTTLLVVLNHPDRAGALRQFDQRHPHIVNQGDQHLADIVILGLGLAEHRPVVGAAQLADGRHPQDAFHQGSDGLAQCSAHLFERQALLAHRAVHHTGCQAVATHLQFRQDDGDIQARGEAVRLPGPVTRVGSGTPAHALHHPAGGAQALALSLGQVDGQALQPLLQVDLTIRAQVKLVANLHHPATPR